MNNEQLERLLREASQLLPDKFVEPSHASEEQINRLLDSAASWEELRPTAAHLAVCDSCRSRLSRAFETKEARFWDQCLPTAAMLASLKAKLPNTQHPIPNTLSLEQLLKRLGVSTQQFAQKVRLTDDLALCLARRLFAGALSQKAIKWLADCLQLSVEQVRQSLGSRPQARAAAFKATQAPAAKPLKTFGEQIASHSRISEEDKRFWSDLLSE